MQLVLQDCALVLTSGIITLEENQYGNAKRDNILSETLIIDFVSLIMKFRLAI